PGASGSAVRIRPPGSPRGTSARAAPPAESRPPEYPILRWYTARPEALMAETRVVIGLPIPDRMAAAYAYFAGASALDFDRDEGLAFDFIYPDEPGSTALALAAGRCQFAPLNTTVGLLAREEGLPLRAVYSMSRRTHRWFSVVPDSPI